jgi:hypothetical protein
MAIVGAALHSRDYCEKAGKRSHAAGPRSPLPKFLTACVVLCSLSFAGCARNPAQREVSPAPAVHERKAPPLRAAARSRQPAVSIRYVELKIRRPDAALLAPQPAPDCEFKRSDLKTVDPDEWARLKVEYERQCYQDAEKAARERLILLQTSSICEIEPVQNGKPVPAISRRPLHAKY